MLSQSSEPTSAPSTPTLPPTTFSAYAAAVGAFKTFKTVGYGFPEYAVNATQYAKLQTLNFNFGSGMLSISLTISYQGLTFVFCVATIPFAKDAQAVARHNVTLTSQGIYQGTIYVLVFVPRTTSQPIDENSAGPFGVLDPRSLTERTLYTICVYFAFSKSFLHVVLTV